MSAIAVFGEMLVDQFESGPVVGGAPFNVARHLAAFGQNPLMLGAIGADDAGALVKAEFDRYGLRRDGLQVLPSLATGQVDVETAGDASHRFHIRGDCAWDHVETGPARQALVALAPEGWLYAGTLGLRSADSRATQLALMREHAGPIYLDVNWREGHVDSETAIRAITLADALKVNDEELAMLCRWYRLPAPAADAGVPELAAIAGELRKQLWLDTVYVTLGPRGALAVTGQETLHSLPPGEVRLVDTVGAGDSFSAVVLHGLSCGWDMQATLDRATAFASRICEIRGAVPADLGAYSGWTAGWPAR